MAETPNRGSGSTGDAPLIVVDAAGKLFAQWGYREILGRVWALLYMSPDALDAKTLRERLSISSGALSMALKELDKLGIVYRETKEGKRRFFYRAETDIWRVITKIFKEHERKRLHDLLDRIQQAEQQFEARAKSSPADELAQFQLEQVRHLVNVGQFTINLLDAFMERTKVELKAARKWLSVSGKLGGEPFSHLRKVINRVRF